jgi:hypothetical protein
LNEANLIQGNGDNVDASESTRAHDVQEQGRLSGIQIPPGTTLEELERAAVEQALNEHQGNRTHAAKSLGISVRTLQRKLKAWHGSNHVGETSANESRTNMSKMRPTNSWIPAAQGMSNPLNLRSHAARV